MPKKAEKRLAQRALHLEKALEKSARQFADPTPKKVVPHTKLPPHRRMMCWDRELEDVQGQWSWGADVRCCDDDWNGIAALGSKLT